MLVINLSVPVRVRAFVRTFVCVCVCVRLCVFVGESVKSYKPNRLISIIECRLCPDLSDVRLCRYTTKYNPGKTLYWYGRGN